MHCCLSVLYQFVFQCSNSVYGNFHFVACFQPYAAAFLMAEDNTCGSSGIDKVAGVEGEVTGAITYYVGAVEDHIVGENLAMTGAIKDAILDIETIAMRLCGRLRDQYPALLLSRYPFAKAVEELADYDDFDLMEAIGRRRGMLISGGEVNIERTAIMLLDEFRACKLGRITLDRYSKEELHA